MADPYSTPEDRIAAQAEAVRRYNAAKQTPALQTPVQDAPDFLEITRQRFGSG